VFEQMPYPWFEYGQNRAGQWTVTEDVPFCQKAQALGYPIAVDPAVKCGHVGQLAITEQWYERSLSEMFLMQQQRDAEQQEPEQVPA